MTAESLKLQGNEAFAGGDMPQASSLYTRALQLCEQDDTNLRRILHGNRAAARLRAGDADGALMDAEEALRLGPGWSKAYARKAGALEALGRLPEAKRALEAALAGEPENITLKESMTRVEMLMANPTSSGPLPPPPVQHQQPSATPNDPNIPSSIDDLFAEVAQIESAANCVSQFSKTTNVDHDMETQGWTRQSEIERILQKHCKFLNLNPYHVFGFQSFEANAEDIKKRFHKLSALVHPDKNPDPRARTAFEFVTNAHAELMNVDRRNLYLEIFASAKARVEQLRASQLRALGGSEARLIQQHGTLKDAIEKEIKLVLAANEAERVKALQIRQANEERAAKAAKEKEVDWSAVKKDEDEFVSGRDERVKEWSQFQKAKRGKMGGGG